MNRSLGCVEKIAWLHNKTAPNNFAMRLRFTGKICEETLKKSLDIIQGKYPVLATKIIETSGEGPIFSSNNVPIIPLKIILNAPLDKWKNILLDELNKEIKISSGPLIRTTYLYDQAKNISELILVITHIACDAISLFYLSHDLLKIINQVEMKDNNVHITINAKPPVENYFQEKIKILDAEKFNLIGENKPAFKEDSKPSAIILKNKSGHSLTTNFATLSFSKELSTRLLLACRTHGITINNILCASLLITFYDMVKAEQTDNTAPNASVKILYNIPINLRPYCFDGKTFLTAKDIGCYTSSVDVFHELAEENDLWTFAADLKNIFNEKIKNNYHIKKLYTRFKSTLHLENDSLELQAKLQSYMSQWLGGYDKASLPLIYLSNIGKVEFYKNYGEHELQEVEFTVTVHDMLTAKNNYLLLAYTDSATEQLTITLPYISPVVTQAMADKFLGEIKNNIVKALNNGHLNATHQAYEVTQL